MPPVLASYLAAIVASRAAYRAFSPVADAWLLGAVDDAAYDAASAPYVAASRAFDAAEAALIAAALPDEVVAAAVDALNGAPAAGRCWGSPGCPVQLSLGL